MTAEPITERLQNAAGHLRDLAGVLLFDYRRYSRAIQASGSDWLALANRYETLEHAPDGTGLRPSWRWTSELHAPKILPGLGRGLLERALRDFPISFSGRPVSQRTSHTPLVSVVIGHRGRERLPLLQTVLRSLAAQNGVSFECIVVEQDSAPQIQPMLPEWVRYSYTPPPNREMPYCRSWALNVGARLARGQLLVLHDNDFVVPENYLLNLALKHRQGYEVINLKRFIFYLSSEHTNEILKSGQITANLSPESIVQNLEAGGSVAISREAFFTIGGFDEAFVGWGGEDNELWERAQTRIVYPFGFLPIFHLWHTSQPGKRATRGQGRRTAQLFATRSQLPVETRIAELSRRNFGDPTGLQFGSLPDSSGVKRHVDP